MTKQNENITISTVFKGGIADNAELPAQEVINAIQGFKDSVMLISNKVYGKDYNINCNLKAPKKGSFELEYVFNTLSVAPVVFNHLSIEQLPQVIDWFFKAFIKTEGKKVKSIEQTSDNGFNINIGDGANVNIGNITINNNSGFLDKSAVQETLNDDNIRKTIIKSHSAISNRKVDEVIYKNNKNNAITTIDKNNYSAFNVLDEIKSEDEKEMRLYINNARFRGKNIWEFENTETGEIFSAPINDAKFQKRIIEGEEFKNGDEIIADVFIIYSDKQNKKNIYSITNVIEHIKAPIQLRI
jgi:hypothetical protein